MRLPFSRDKVRFLVDVRPLRASRDFRRLWAASTLSSISSALTAFAVPLQAYDLTHSTIAVGGIGVAEMAPTLTIGLLGGPPSLRRGSFGDGAISLWAKRPQGPVQVEKSQPCSGEKPAVVTTTIALPTNSRLSTKAAATRFCETAVARPSMGGATG